MQYRNLTGAIVGMIVTSLLFAAPAAAQCEICDDSNVTQTSCVPADWDEMGNTDCEEPEGGVGFCPPQSPPDCWGDPHFATNLDVRPDGTIRWRDGDIRSESMVRSAELVWAEALGFSAEARILERDCKGLIVDRVYGAAVMRALAKESNLLVI